MDKLDKKILQIVQTDGALTASELGERVGLSAMPAWRRLRRLDDGFRDVEDEPARPIVVRASIQLRETGTSRC